MKLLARRRETANAEARLQRERAIWNVQTRSLRERIESHRTAIAIGSGALAGLLCGILPLRSIARIGRLCTGVAAFALRTPIAAMLVDGMKLRAQPAEVLPQEHLS